jgi:hypothetical protein
LTPTHVRYRLRVPFSELGVSGKQLETGSPMLGFALAVNDNDGTGRKGAIRWADGIVHRRQRSLPVRLAVVRVTIHPAEKRDTDMKRTIFFTTLLAGAVLAAAPPADEGNA